MLLDERNEWFKDKTAICLLRFQKRLVQPQNRRLLESGERKVRFFPYFNSVFISVARKVQSEMAS